MSSGKVGLGRRIKSLRLQAKMKQETVAEAIGIDVKSLSRIERGAHYPSLETLESISNALKVPMRDFFDSPEESESDLRRYVEKAATSLDSRQLRAAVLAIKLITKDI